MPWRLKIGHVWLFGAGRFGTLAGIAAGHFNVLYSIVVPPLLGFRFIISQIRFAQRRNSQTALRCSIWMDKVEIDYMWSAIFRHANCFGFSVRDKCGSFYSLIWPQNYSRTRNRSFKPPGRNYRRPWRSSHMTGFDSSFRQGSPGTCVITR
jgi:hypothetical protein